MMKNLLKKFLLRPWFYIRIAVVIGFAFVSSGFIYLKATHQLSPGPLSTTEHDIALGGVSSHAELSENCSHCHAPIHCLEDTRCQDCHIEIAREREDTNSLHGRIPGVSRCQTCHPEHNGADADLTKLAFTNIDHYMLAGFSLAEHSKDYAGADMNCDSCHMQDGSFVNQTDCITCHSAEDHDYIASHIEEYGLGCSECHDGKDRMVAGDFDHNAFPLANGHENQDCIDCHTQKTYAGTDSSCLACHEEPEVHVGQFGLQCALCHTDVAWTPAELISHSFGLKHADEPIASCEECHTSTYTEYTCVSCHEDEEMQPLHAALDTAELDNCAGCHPTGLEGEVPLKAAPGNQNQNVNNPEQGPSNEQPGNQNGSHQNGGPGNSSPNQGSDKQSGKDQ